MEVFLVRLACEVRTSAVQKRIGVLENPLLPHITGTFRQCKVARRTVAGIRVAVFAKGFAWLAYLPSIVYALPAIN